KTPGLLRQHLTGVRAAARVSAAQVEGDELGSDRLVFRPNDVEGGVHEFRVGSAGSAVLVLQPVLPAVLRAREPSRVTVEGGTHARMAPPFDFFAKTYLALLRRMGVNVSATLERPGFYPAGGGVIALHVEPCDTIGSLRLIEMTEAPRLKSRAMVAHVPRHVAERELAVVKRKLKLSDSALEVVECPRSVGPGNAVLVDVKSEGLTEVYSAFGRRGVTAESVAEDVVREVKKHLARRVPVGEYLADQLMLPLALGAGGSYVTGPASLHATTNAEVIRRFLDVSIEFVEVAKRRTRVDVQTS
ncbi:MAG: RNA 3'-terminal phosphate cyclase, partial [Acidobacteriota bacterium]